MPVTHVQARVRTGFEARAVCWGGKEVCKPRPSSKRRYVDGSLELFARLCVPDSARNPYRSADRCYRQQCGDTVE